MIKQLPSPWLAINPSLTGIIEWTGAPDLWKPVQACSNTSGRAGRCFHLGLQQLHTHWRGRCSS
uniref:Uncharacterized protein n=1 Tax=Anguilla anguilla TaxID=7936 RepID=A0A0E9XM67_ANGAN